jgi:hypothetical protein
VFGTSAAKIIRTQDFETFTLVATFGSGRVIVAALGTVVLAGNGSSIRRSTDSGASYGSPYSLASQVLSNGRHFIAGGNDRIYTSTTGIDIASWVERLNAGGLGSAVYPQGGAYTSGDLAVFATFGTYAYVGDVS